MSRVGRHNERVAAALRASHGQACGSGRLADAALATDEHEPLARRVEQLLPRRTVGAAEGEGPEVLERVDAAHLRLEERHTRDAQLCQRRLGRVEIPERPLLLAVDLVDVRGRGLGRDELVDHQVVHRHVLLHQRREQTRRLGHSQPCRNGHHNKVGCLLVGEKCPQVEDARAHLLQPAHRSLQLGRRVRLWAEHARQQVERALHARLELDELVQQVVDEVGERQQPEGVAGRRGVEDDAVVVAGHRWVIRACPHQRQHFGEGEELVEAGRRVV
mmetsp:Transcript_31441/g.101683  ORF Transcript_31441/g.101683 Transcript_31441/m.101683 type:complete len:274 (-) Transcript_31441:541-1362(-)